jgi:hypothetical protein
VRCRPGSEPGARVLASAAAADVDVHWEVTQMVTGS